MEKNPAAVALGKMKSKKKAISSRLNGKKGGRPCKKKYGNKFPDMKDSTK